MSDGMTEAYRGMRKSSYLGKIEVKKDQLFDEYIDLSKRLLQVNKNLVKFSRSEKTLFGKPKPDFILMREQEKLSFEISIRMDETLKLIAKLDTEYVDGMAKPLKEF